MEEDVHIKVSADGGDAQQALERMADSFEKIASKGKKVGEEGAGGFGKMAEEAGKLGKELLGAGSAMDLVEKGLELLKDQIEAYVEFQKHAFEHTLTKAQAQSLMLDTVGPNDFKAASQAGEEAAGRLGVESTKFLPEFAGALPSRGDLSWQDALKMSELAASMRPDYVGTGKAGQLAGSALMLQGEQPDLDSQSALATVMAGSGASALQSPAQFGAAFAPITKRMRGVFGEKDDVARWMGTAAGISSRIGDTTGTETATFEATFYEHLRDKAVAAGFQGSSEEELEKWLKESEEGKDLVSKMLAGINDPETQEGQLFGARPDLPGRAKTKVAAQEILQGFQGKQTPTTSAIERGRAATVGAEHDAKSYLSKYDDARKSTREQNAADLHRQAESAGESFKEDPMAAFRGQIVEDNQTLDEAMGKSALTRRLTRWGMTWGLSQAKTPEEAADLGTRGLKVLDQDKSLNPEQHKQIEELIKKIDHMADAVSRALKEQKIHITSDDPSQRGHSPAEGAGQS